MFTSHWGTEEVGRDRRNWGTLAPQQVEALIPWSLRVTEDPPTDLFEVFSIFILLWSQNESNTTKEAPAKRQFCKLMAKFFMELLYITARAKMTRHVYEPCLALWLLHCGRYLWRNLSCDLSRKLWFQSMKITAREEAMAKASIKEGKTELKWLRSAVICKQRNRWGTWQSNLQ